MKLRYDVHENRIAQCPALFDVETGYLVAVMKTTGTWEEDELTAREIARRVNVHDQLLEALEFIVNDSPEPGEDAVLSVKGYNMACAAIAAAK